jgi:hypothetical protein
VSVRMLAWMGVLLAVGVAGVTALLWPFHSSLLWSRAAPPPHWSFAPLAEGVRFPRSEQDVYLSTPTPQDDSSPGSPSARPPSHAALGTAEAAARLLQRKGGSHAKADSVATTAEPLSLPTPTPTPR